MWICIWLRKAIALHRIGQERLCALTRDELRVKHIVVEQAYKLSGELQVEVIRRW